MKRFILLLLVGCSSEPVGQTSQPWADTCYMTYLPQLSSCETYIYWKCKDGSGGLYIEPALMQSFLGQPCLYNGQTLKYVCAINAWGKAMLVCGE